MFDNLTYFHFLRPWWLLALPIAIFIYWQFNKNQNLYERYEKFIAPHLLKHLVVGKNNKFSFKPIHLIITIILIAILSVAGPTWKREAPPFTEDKAPLVVLLSLSESMDAVDISPTRLKRAKQKIIELLKLRSGSRTSIFVYAGTSHMVLPLTTDFRILEMFLSPLSSALMPKDGSNTDIALKEVDKYLKDEEVPGTILLVSDSIEKESFSTISEIEDSTNNQIIVLAVGTKTGAPISIGNNKFRMNKNGTRKIAKMNVDSFKNLRDSYGIKVISVTVNNDDVEWIQRNIKTHLEVAQQHTMDTNWIEYGYYLVFPLIILMLYWFRRGWSVKWLFILFFYTSFYATDINAQNYEASDSTTIYSWEWFYNLWMTNDQQGRMYFEDSNYVKAAQKFDNNMWKGISFYKSTNYEEAIIQFVQVNSAESNFMLGNSYAHLGNYELAVSSYKQALSIYPGFSEASYNLKLIEEIILRNKKKEDDEEEDVGDPRLKADDVTFDDKGKKGKAGKVDKLKLTPEKMAEMWMRNIQTSPAKFLQRKFYQQSENDK